MKPEGILPLSIMGPGFVPAAPKPDSAEISSTAGWALLCSPGWVKHHTGLVSQTMLPPSIADFTPQPSGPAHHQQCPGGTLPCSSLSPTDSPELGLLDLVAARNVLENLVQLQRARGAFTVYPSLNRDAAATKHRRPLTTPGPPTPVFFPGHGKRLQTEAKQELQITCPKANPKSQ